MAPTPARERARDLVLRRFAWEHGHADVWRLFDDAECLAAVVDGLVEPSRDQRITKVVGIEARGFLLGGAAAVTLGVGFVAVRKHGALFPGEKTTAETAADYRGNRHTLEVQRASIRPNDRLLLVDDWIETGNQATAVCDLVQQCGATLAAIAVIVDQLDDGARSTLPALTSVVTAAQLAPNP